MRMLKRRELIVGGAAVIGAGVALTSAAAAEKAAPRRAGAPAHELAAAASECVRIGEACLQHCLDRLGTGDTSLAACAESVTQMLAICRAVGPFAVAATPHLPALARVCHDVCVECERECRKHETHHAVCKQCADACARVVTEAKKIAG
jgi:Cys-rich four helix bundle protein (predicted Tat secretion target)